MPSGGGEHGCPCKTYLLTELIMIFLPTDSGPVIAKNNNSTLYFYNFHLIYFIVPISLLKFPNLSRPCFSLIISTYFAFILLINSDSAFQVFVC